MDENRKDYERLEQLKKQYEQINMSKEQVEQMKKRIEEAKQEKQQMRKEQHISENQQTQEQPHIPGQQPLQNKQRIPEKQQTQEKQQVPGQQQTQNKQKMSDRKKKPFAVKIGLAAAAAAAAFILIPNVSKDAAYAMSRLPIVGGLVEVVTFRDYQYEDDRHHADVNVPELVPNQTLTPGQTPVTDQASDSGQTAEPNQAAGSESAKDAGTESSGNNTVQENLKKTTEEINAEIREITDQIIAEFEENAKEQWGYQDIMIKHEILTTSENYFTLKLICYQGAGSGAEWDYFYTIDLKTGERLALADLFKEGADYITPISENIKEQMQARMDADENVYYWLNDEIEEWNFKQITDETSFYLNADDNIVISFNEGDVAPMYMGCVEFEIPNEVVEGIRQ